MSAGDRTGDRFPVLSSSCPACGEVDLPPERMWLVEMSVPELSYYAFACPRCEAVVQRPAGPQHRAVLRRWVPTEYWQVPDEALQPRPATPLTVDDVLDLMVALRDLETPPAELAPYAAGVPGRIRTARPNSGTGIP